MTRLSPIPFQFDRPAFVKVPFDGGGKHWKQGAHFPWKEVGVSETKATILYNQGYIQHNSDLEAETLVGDGLEALGVEGLHGLVDSINKKVKAKTASAEEFKNKKCKKSQIPDKQRGLIRSWRRNFGRLETE